VPLLLLPPTVAGSSANWPAIHARLNVCVLE
jgi:hypothetical protein